MTIRQTALGWLRSSATGIQQMSLGWGHVAASGGSSEDHYTGGSISDSTTQTIGAGIALEATTGGAIGTVVALSLGGGTAHEVRTGGAISTVVTLTYGAGTKWEDSPEPSEDHYSGGSVSTAAVVALGSGQAQEHLTGGSTVSVTILSQGSGTAEEHVSGSSISAVVSRGLGSGTAAEHASGGSVSTVVTVVRGGQAISPSELEVLMSILQSLGLLPASAAPSGAIVGTTDEQTLTNKTLTAPKIASILDSGGTIRISLDATGAIAISGSYGTAGQVLTSGGEGEPASWQNPPGGADGPMTAADLFHMHSF